MPEALLACAMLFPSVAGHSVVGFEVVHDIWFMSDDLG